MRNYDTKLRLFLARKNDKVVLVYYVLLPEFKNLKIEIPPDEKFDPNISAEISIIFKEKTDPGQVQDTHVPCRGYIVLGDYPQSTGTTQTITLKDWYQNSGGQPVYLKYPFSVIITGQSGRKTITYISEDAEINLDKSWEDISSEMTDMA